ncbi:MAG: diguanylate cyclase [Veillonellaceae bacterium]|nr:diguanylate cyclase [Veillonellaceae bacterium]
MTLRKKTLLVICLIVVSFSLVLVLSANQILLSGFLLVENRESEKNLQRAMNAIKAEEASLAAFLEDWAVWDDTYQFVAGANADYLKKNLTASTFLTQRLQLMAFLDPAGRIVHAVLFDPATKTTRNIPAALESALKPGSILLSHSTADSTVQGLINLPEAPLLVASRPILDSEHKQAPRGSMVIGRFLHSAELARIANITHLSLALVPYDAALGLTVEKPVRIEPVSEEIIAGYALLSDIRGNPALLLRVESPRSIYSQGKRTVQYFLYLLLAFGVLIGLVNLLLLKRTVLSRLFHLGGQVTQIGRSNNPSLRVQLSGNDELSSLAKSINRMLAALETVQNELTDSEAATRALLDGMPDSLLRLDRSGIILDFKSSPQRSTATPARLLPGNSLAEVYPAAFAEQMLAALAQAFVTNHAQCFEQELAVNNQRTRQEVRISPISETEAIAVLRDFTERRQLEQSLQFFHLRDPLTGLANRMCWEEKLAALSFSAETPVGIILCEIDEMRLIYDSLGQEQTNQLLTATANVLRSVLPLNATVARIGLDRFAALLSDMNEPAVLRLAQKIRQEVEQLATDQVHLHFGLSLGCAWGNHSAGGVQELLGLAQTRLHREKLGRSQAARRALFQSLQATLENRDFVMHQHAERLWALGRAVAKEAGLSGKRLRDFKLLTQFHDIGKVGLPADLLFKQERLSTEDMSQMKLHVEIGYRIAQSIPELSSIADLLLKHHEWWNGQGYPLGLSGEAIPLECRIFAIVDAYDAMTNDRPGRKALAKKEAAAELRRCAGSQFDPELVQELLLIIGE